MDTNEMNSFSIDYVKWNKYAAVIYATSYITPLDYIEEIEKMLRHHFSDNCFILFDLLLSNGECFNRFVEAYFDGNRIIADTLSLVSLSSREVDILNMHYKGRATELNKSILTASKKLKYMK